MSPIKGITENKRLPRLGKIHLGVRHPEKGYPMKTDYFVCPPEVQEVFGEKPRELRILIPIEDEEKWASQYYRCYSKTRGLICKGDGETAMRMLDTQTGAMADRDSKEVVMKEMTCAGRDCEDYRVKCKEVMNLQFLLPDVIGLGVWQIDTSSMNSIRNINSTAELVKAIYKRISMIPLLLTLEPKDVQNPDDGKKQTVYVMNLRVKEKLTDLAIAARKQAEIYLLPAGDDERPDLVSPEFEPDPVELPPDERTTEQVVEDLFPKDPLHAKAAAEAQEEATVPPKEKPKAKTKAKKVEPPEPVEKDETPVTPEQLETLVKTMNETGMTYADLGKFCNKDHDWNIGDFKKELKVWQYNIIIEAFEKGKA